MNIKFHTADIVKFIREHKPDGVVHGWVDDKLHQQWNSEGQLVYESWWVDGKQHRVGDPAIQEWNSEGKLIREQWQWRVDGKVLRT